MKTWVLIFFMAIICQGFSRESLAATEKRRFKAMVEWDTVSLNQLLDDDLVYTHSNGLVENKRDFILSVWTEKIRYEAMELVEQKIVPKGNTAVITGIVKVKGKLKGKEFDVLLRYTDVYIKRKQWKLVAWQSTKI